MAIEFHRLKSMISGIEQILFSPYTSVTNILQRKAYTYDECTNAACNYTTFITWSYFKSCEPDLRKVQNIQ